MHPILFQLGPIRVYSFGVMVMLGFLAAAWWATRSGARRGISPETVMDAALFIFVPAMVFARLLFVALNYRDYHSLAEIAMVWQGGMSFHGGLLGGVLGGMYFCRLRKISAWDLADVVAPGIAIGYAIGRIGCFLNGCCYGSECHLPWAMRFPDLNYPGMLTPPSHPAMLYSSIAGLLMFGILTAVDKRRKYAGQTFLTFLVLYCVYRFLIEYVRAGVTAVVAVDGLTQAQIASVVIALVALAVAFRRSRKTGAQTSAGNRAKP
ncbi:MAG TPA: prolipoprotein diacylglyceryl transferase [Armatimonadota bacterium]|jgi:phosphatidylglycerol:prolipoprotein diacylglycerol transferase